MMQYPVCLHAQGVARHLHVHARVSPNHTPRGTHAHDEYHSQASSTQVISI
jgi:hypothetical protein